VKSYIVEGARPPRDIMAAIGLNLSNAPRVGIRTSGYAKSNTALNLGASGKTVSVVQLGSETLVISTRLSGLAGQNGWLRVFRNSSIDLRLPQIGPSGLATANMAQSWSLSAWDIQGFRAAGLDGGGIRVGIIDSGLDIDHAAFRSLVGRGGLKAIASFAMDGATEAEAWELQTGLKSVTFNSYSHWHGTHCACILAGDGDGASKGVAPGVDLYVAKVLDNNNNATVASIYAGLEWLRQFNCDIISASIGWHGYRDQWAKPVLGLLQQGAVVVAASGNEFGLSGLGQSRSPANYVYPKDLRGAVVSVGAIREDGVVWARSGGEDIVWPSTYEDDDEPNRPTYFSGARSIVPDVVGPGVDIPAAMPGNTFGMSSGTSMATPFVAGLVALILQRLRVSDVAVAPRVAADVLMQCTSDVPPKGKDTRYGLGIPSHTALLNRLFP
jgi:subtilisin family serine protease